jgi:glucose uptake protein GlcU
MSRSTPRQDDRNDAWKYIIAFVVLLIAIYGLYHASASLESDKHPVRAHTAEAIALLLVPVVGWAFEHAAAWDRKHNGRAFTYPWLGVLVGALGFLLATGFSVFQEDTLKNVLQAYAGGFLAAALIGSARTRPIKRPAPDDDEGDEDDEPAPQPEPGKRGATRARSDQASKGATP